LKGEGCGYDQRLSKDKTVHLAGTGVKGVDAGDRSASNLGSPIREKAET